MNWCRQQHFCRFLSKISTPRRLVSSKAIRHEFIEFFGSNDHVFVPSSSVVPSKGDGTYFVNAGMNQFKPIFLGSLSPDSSMAHLKRAVNSQKCIRVGGKHNDLDDVGQDETHHTFFEMLGSWSFGDYFKKEAQTMAWQLLTEGYCIPKDRLYVTYFGGDPALDLPADNECREHWLSLGISPSRIFPLGIKDNFWEMGDTGPCGPCTEIHYDRLTNDPTDACERLNRGDMSIVELWNLVFMQFNREADGSLRTLPRQHVDTGMGLERITAVLQGVRSNYDTDLFLPLFDTIQKQSKCKLYSGQFGRSEKAATDTAYRVIADHIRMLTVAMTDGLVPGRKGLDARVRQIMYRAFKNCAILGAPPGLMGQLVPVVVESLGDAFPELRVMPDKIQDILNSSEERYKQQMNDTEKILRKALDGNSTLLSTTTAQRIVSGEYGLTISPDILKECANNLDIKFDLDLFQQSQSSQTVVQDIQQNYHTLNQFQIEHLVGNYIPSTNDSYKYSSMDDLESQFAYVLAMVDNKGNFTQHAVEGSTVGLVLDQTSFYAEGGGQAPDTGVISTAEGCVLQVCDVQRSHQYVLHTCTVNRGSIGVGDKVQLAINLDDRHKCACNHTATHLLNHALREVLGGAVWQAGSSVTHQKLVFDFRSLQTLISADDINAISSKVNECIDGHLPVHRAQMPFKEIENHTQLVKLDQEVYPSTVSVISIGKSIEEIIGNESLSMELCGGTHVSNTADLESFVISHFHGSGQGTKKVTALTGQLAVQAVENGNALEKDVDKLENFVNNDEPEDILLSLSDHIDKAFSDGRPLSKVVRDELYTRFDRLKWKGVRSKVKKSHGSQVQEEIAKGLCSQNVVVLKNKTKMRDVLKIVAAQYSVSALNEPSIILFVSSDTGQLQGMLIAPKTSTLNGDQWMEWLKKELKVQAVKEAKTVKFKSLTDVNVWTMIAQKSDAPLMSSAATLCHNFLKETL